MTKSQHTVSRKFPVDTGCVEIRFSMKLKYVENTAIVSAHELPFDWEVLHNDVLLFSVCGNNTGITDSEACFDIDQLKEIYDTLQLARVWNDSGSFRADLKRHRNRVAAAQKICAYVVELVLVPWPWGGDWLWPVIQFAGTIDSIVKTLYNDRPGGRPEQMQQWDTVAEYIRTLGPDVVEDVATTLDDIVNALPEMYAVYDSFNERPGMTYPSYHSEMKVTCPTQREI